MQPQASPAQSALESALANIQQGQGQNPMNQAMAQRGPQQVPLPQMGGMTAPGVSPFGQTTGQNFGTPGAQPGPGLELAGQPQQGDLAQALQSDPRYQQTIGQIGNFLSLLNHPLAQAFNQFHGLGGQPQQGQPQQQLPQMGGQTAGAIQMPQAGAQIPQTPGGGK